MAATMMTIPPAGTIEGKPDLGVCTSMRSPPSSSNWWSPLLGLSAEPDYIQDKIDQSGGRNQDLKGVHRSRLVLTEEKAKQLRKMTREAEAFHDVMYHSAVASRLALDFSARSSSGR